MYLLKLLFFIVLVLFLSCSPAKDEKNLSVEVEPIQLKPTLVHFKGNEVLYPTEFAIIDSSLLIIESEAKEHKFKFFDLVDHQFHHSFGVEGNGPDEYSKFIAQPVSAVDSKTLQLYDWSKKKLNVFDLKYADSIPYSKINEFSLPPELMLTQKAALINDSIIISGGDMDKGFISFTKATNSETRYYNPVHHDLENYTYREKSYFFQSDIALHTEKELIAIAPKYFPAIQIIDFRGNDVANYELSSEIIIDDILNGITDITNMKTAFFGIAASNEYIFATYTGKTNSELDEALDQDNSKNINVTNVLQFNWKGDLIKKYELQSGFYPFLAVDEINNRLYSLNSLSNEMVYFDLDALATD